MSRQIPEGWDNDMVSTALDNGYSLLEINMLQPTRRHWSFKMLLSNYNTHNLTLLDPFLVQKQQDQSDGNIDENTGFKSTHGLEFCRQRKIGL